jgi:hypothetical protein
MYAATYHAREWISTEVNRRLLRWYIDQWRSNDASIQNLLASTELWFVLVHNPDGYEYTFDHERLWRKNLRDNDGDSQITNADGVDPNRNHDEHWNWDDEGSDSQISGQTYRGPSPSSEPETQALLSLFARVDFNFAISWHSFGQLLLYTQGWQVLTPSADDPIYVALSGTDTNPAIPGFNPGVGADLYTTNGEFTDWAHAEEQTLAWTPELSEGCPGCGFVFPDSPSAVQAEFVRTRDFALNVAKSANDPDDPVSHAGIDTDAFYLDVSQIDPWKTNWPTSDLTVDESYGGGSSQPVEVLAKRAIGRVTLRYRIDSGPTQSIRALESPNGDVFGGNNAYDVYYHYMRASIPVQQGDEVEYWFTGGGQATEHVTFDVVEDADADVLVLAAEDRTGASTVPPYANSGPGSAPNYLDFYTDAIEASGRTWDVYDVDAQDRTAPDHLGVLGHYDAVIWYRGNDLHVREPGWPGGNVSRLAVDETLEVRQYLNQGGTLMYTGQWAGATEHGLGGEQRYDPVANLPCTTSPPEVQNRCLRWDDKNDFFQYFMGSYIYNSDGGTDPNTFEPFPVQGTDEPYTGMNWTLNGPGSAENHAHTASFVTTSSILKPDEYPQFTSDARAEWDRGIAGSPPFEPHSGDHYLYSNRADISYKRLTQTLDLTSVAPADADLSFFASYDTEAEWDYLIVEARTPGQDDWTTLPEADGETTDDTGQSCPEGWHTDPNDEIHPHLAHYQTYNAGPPPSCTPTGSEGDPPGEWNGAYGRSDGWEEWNIDLSAYAGGPVEIHIAYVSDWGTQGLGVWLDDIDAPGTAADTGFETADMGGWTVSGAAEGSDPNPNDWERTTSVNFEEGAIVSQTPPTADFITLFFGFGFETITGVDSQAAVMDKSLDFLGV